MFEDFGGSQFCRWPKVASGSATPSVVAQMGRARTWCTNVQHFLRPGDAGIPRTMATTTLTSQQLQQLANSRGMLPSALQTALRGVGVNAQGQRTTTQLIARAAPTRDLTPRQIWTRNDCVNIDSLQQNSINTSKPDRQLALQPDIHSMGNFGEL